MITSLRRKFILVAMASTLVVLAVIMGIVNYLNYHRMAERADQLISLLLENDGKFPNHFQGAPMPETNPVRPHYFNEETPFATRFFFVHLDQSGMITDIDTRKIAAINEEQAIHYVKAALKKDKRRGFVSDYRYGTIKTSNGEKMVFVDCRQELENYKNLIYTSLGVSSIGIFSVFILVFIFSRKVFKPVEESYHKQKQFITDASHELKTPLTIIDANTEVMEMISGENQWTISTRKQVLRLSELTNNLVILSRMDEKGNHIEKSNFSFTKTVEELLESFDIVANQAQRIIHADIDNDISMDGDENNIRQLVEILLDNALKYSLPDATINVTLKQYGKWIHFIVDNPCEKLPSHKMDILFERFYRLDNSRNSKTGGSGIGLSMAQAIVQAHKGKIYAQSKDLYHLTIRVELKA